MLRFGRTAVLGGTLFQSVDQIVIEVVNIKIAGHWRTIENTSHNLKLRPRRQCASVWSLYPYAAILHTSMTTFPFSTVAGYVFIGMMHGGSTTSPVRMLNWPLWKLHSTTSPSM